MALITCKECGAQVSSTSAVCPQCGAPLKYVTCPDCGTSIPANVDICPNCGAPQKTYNHRRTALDKNISPDLEKSNDFNAEHVVNAVAKIGLIVGIIIGVVGVIGGIVLCSDGSEIGIIYGIISIVVGILMFLIGLLSWATLRLFVNMSYRLTRIDNKMQPE